MSLPDPARFALMLGEPAWQRAAFDAHTALVDGVVQLAWEARGEGGVPLPPFGADDAASRAGAGLAFDALGRLFHSVPGEQRIERWPWCGTDPGPSPVPLDVLVGHTAAPRVVGALPSEELGFAPAMPALPRFQPRALACDDEGLLYALDTAVPRVWIVDPLQRRLLRAEAVPADARHVAWFGGWLWVACESGQLLRLAARRAPQPAPVRAPAGTARLAFAADGRLFVLLRAHAADAALQLLGRPGQWLAQPQPLGPPPGAPEAPFAWASGLAVAGTEGQPQHLVVARRREESFTRVALAPEEGYALAEPWAARHYDGLGIAAAPDGRVVFFTARGPRSATAARLHYHGAGRVVGFRLDAGQPQARWGRVLLDACVPPQTAIRVHAIVNDDEIDGPRLPRSAPANQTLQPIPQAEATPLPLRAWLPGADEPGQPLVRRSDGSEQPWLVEAERFDTFEAVAPAVPGRYLWLVFELQGHSRATPRLRGVRAETPAHDWMRRLPQLFERHEGMRQFLQRYLAPLAGLHEDLAAQAAQRHALLKPCSTPAAALPWLAHWVGLTLDERWSEAARRRFIQEAPALFRRRGTVWALRRMLEIVTGARVVLFEEFRLRGLGRVAGEVGTAGGELPAVLGMGLRVGGALGSGAARDEDAGRVDDSFARHAHRFSVLVQTPLDADTEAAVRHLLEQHRPAHTLFTLCPLGRGAGLGRGLLMGLSTVLGPRRGFTPWQLGAGTLGRGQVLGQPMRGVRPGSAVLGRDNRMG